MWYLWGPRASFDSCIAATSGGVVLMRCLSSSTVLLMPFALSCRIFISLCFVLEVLFVSCVGVCVAGVGAVGGGATYGSLWDGNMWGESGGVGCMRSRV